MYIIHTILFHSNGIKLYCLEDGRDEILFLHKHTFHYLLRHQPLYSPQHQSIRHTHKKEIIKKVTIIIAQQCKLHYLMLVLDLQNAHYPTVQISLFIEKLDFSHLV